MSFLSIENLNTFYGDTQVLWDIDMTVGPGELVALVGANGAGKTTLLRTLTGLLAARSGRILFKGEDLTALPPEQRLSRGVAMVPEGRRLFAGLTVEQNLRLGAYLRRDHADIAFDLQRIYEYFPRLGELRRRVSGHLSGGEQQMCAVGRALMGRPQLLLVDEMSLGLAPVIVDRLAEVLIGINKAFETAIVVVEQDVELALEMASRAYALETGRVVMHGPAEELLNQGDIQAAYLGHID
ncbi:ABC transporter ATP-binding protein [Verticiella sediminum]|uniref:ABC transporter ATP-binding protein n=1 Tax=Verticiella sediminum TaxID=1247510 RepID=A0A556ACG7_9BURK|nr:ABC transporter ATP-binding protein [Verticiella sediminum]TSH90579.1 ABC transporter ATP-binding protein [Verticiella sediminum]